MSAQLQPVGLDFGKAVTFQPSVEAGPTLPEALALAFPDMLATVQHMRRVTDWLNDSDNALDTLWAVPEQGAASMMHIAGQVVGLEDGMTLVTALMQDVPTTDRTDLAPELRRCLGQRSISGLGNLEMRIDLEQEVLLPISGLQIRGFMACLGLLSTGLHPKDHYAISCSNSDGRLNVTLCRPWPALAPATKEQLFKPEEQADLSQQHRLGFSGLWVLSRSLNAKICLRSDVEEGMMQVGIEIPA